ncbi:50S ribosomal protein L13 [Candidatus Dojkabacteria bacterium]|uniref:Large ribosomal subunit protein uL13 n=1 Tax=Candidatus Dojkabacteria bacterium TaxID=2099670 RepID=A0A955L818_9BACT|nr:50S ribosomal protein L13 [Candidatus Dojkabacteria bacterium]
MNTRSVKASEIQEKWYVVDAAGVRLGKLATHIASILAGKHNVESVPYLTPKNKVIVVNTKKVDIHPRKKIGKIYYSHSGFPGGFNQMEYQDLKEKRPNKIVRLAVNGMLPKTKQRNDIMANLFLYEDGDHKHEAQQPEAVEVSK